MDAADVLNCLNRLGVGIRADGENIVVSPAGRIPPEVKGDIKEHKGEILTALRRVGDGWPPPLDRPPATEQELGRLYDHWREQGEFIRWLEGLMAREE